MSPAPVLRGAPVARLVHVCLEPLPDGGHPVVGTRLTHQRRAGVILQAAGLLSLLERAGWGLAGWDVARLGPEGRLSVCGRLGPARSPRPAQELLRDLLTRLYGPGDATLRGPGSAKSALRGLADRWRQSLAPLAPDAAVMQILELAPFLWEPAFADDRSALVGELHRFDGSEERVALWVAGPSSFRRKVLAAASTLSAARDLLADPEARRLWNREEQGDPRALAAAGRWRAALAAWDRRPPAGEAEQVERSRTLAAVGRFEAALAALAGLDSPGALLARAECQLSLGQPGAALGALRGLQEARLSPEEAALLAEIAGRARANQGPAESALPWLRRALGAAGPAGSPTGLRARIAAAAAAWDRRDLDAMERLLAESRPALDHPDLQPDLAWRWHQVRSLWEMEAPDGASRAVEHAEEALRLARRVLPRRSFPRHQAADLWNEIGRARAAAGDLPGAERAFLHLVRLLEGCDGPRGEMLALPNLAEIRLRRGRLAGVRDILERAGAQNRRVGNVRGQAEDAGLWARFELVLGRPGAALTLCRQGLADLERQGLTWHRPELLLLSARALGWLDRPADAAAALREVPQETARELEPEERPALYALAGDLEQARRESESLTAPDLRALWMTLLDGEIPPSPVWGALAALEPYRAARLVHDAERLLPGSTPADVRHRASGVLRDVGAAPLAEALDARDRCSWQALTAQLLMLLSRERETSSAQPVLPEAPRTSPRPGGEMVGESVALRNAIERLDRLASGDFPLLILGESGTGKELAARRVHRASRRASAPFVAVNCAALSETLLLSELFGHVKGAFTGADKDRAGVFQTAHGGTVFLDEIGDLPLNAQSTLLRVLQEGEIRRLGDNVTRKVDVRILAATHRDLAVMVEEKSFRLDLYHRLKVGHVELPALRDRGDDVLLLTERVLDRTGARLSHPARDLLVGYAWPGNVRELQNVLSAAAALAGGGVIGPEHLDLPAAGPPPGLSYHEQIDAERRRVILKNLNDCGGRLAATARRLGLSRQGLHHLLQELGLADRSRARRPAAAE
jgi:two-component system NtrC family response regulator